MRTERQGNVALMASTNPKRRRSPAGHRLAPPSPRGQRTRAALIVAARSVFERDGYLDARTTDIAEQANVASGTFYTLLH